MKIKRLYIKDFGIFREEKIDEITGDIIVIGGYNRAGKTSFMEVLRHLGYGFLSSNKNIPKPNIQYGVSADIEKEKNIYNIEINGNKMPVVRNLKNKESLPVSNIYNIDYFTYKELFTISLDELENYNVKNLKNIGNIQTILLGAGFKEIAYIPKIIKELDKKSIKIGGKNGNVSTAQFKECNKLIKEGIKIKKQGKALVKEYYIGKKELKELYEKINIKENSEKVLEEKINKIRFIKDNFETYIRVKNIYVKSNILKEEEKIYNFQYGEGGKATILKEEYEKNLNEYNVKERNFSKDFTKNIEFKKKIMENKDKINYFYKRISGISEKIENYKEEKNNCIRKKEMLMDKIREVNENWVHDLKMVLDIKTDILNMEEVAKVIDDYNDLSYKKDLIENEIKSLGFNEKMARKNNENILNINGDKIIKKYFYISLGIIAFGIVIAFLDYKIGSIISISGGILCSVYGGINYLSSKKSKGKHEKTYSVRDEINLKREEKEKIYTKLNEKEEKIQGYKKILKLDKDVSKNTIKEYFRQVKELKNKIITTQILIDKVKNIKRELHCEISEMIKLLKKLNLDNCIESDENLIIEDSSNLFNIVVKLKEEMELVKEIEKVELRQKTIEKSALELIGQEYKDNILDGLDKYIYTNHKHKELLELGSERKVLEKNLNGLSNYCDVDDYKKVFKKYATPSEINNEYNDLIKEKNDLKMELKDLGEKREKLIYKLNILKSTEKIKVSQEYIDEGRKKLKSLSKKYAAIRGSEYILKKMQEDFFKNTKETLLKQSSEYLSYITKGEIKKIIPPSDLTTLNFKTVFNNGETKDTPDILSRGTREQLFLSIRLSRIREIQSRLPVILDDSLVNFDENHIKKVIEILSELSKTNQIFVATCHPKLVKYIGDISSNIQYLKLEKGKFNLCNKEQLVHYLS